LQLEQEVVGITKFCELPARWHRTKTKVGGTKNIHLDRIFELQPDLIIANKEENTQESIEELARHYPVWISDVHDLSSALDMITQVGMLTNRATLAEGLAHDIQQNFADDTAFAERQTRLKVVYLIWRKPYMTVGGDTFIHAMLEAAGFINIFGKQLRYPAIEVDELEASQADCILLSSEPYPFREKHLAEIQKLCPQAVVALVDGQAFSWYGSRLLQAPAYFRKLRAEISKNE
jgi:ABC-type Fe3+-hydroxamate transport system substrate-binding protein